MIFDALKKLFGLLDGFVRRISEGRFWLWKTALAAALLSLFLSFPRPETFFPDPERTPEIKALTEKSAEPFVHHEYPSGSHQAKLTFRMLMPVIAKLSGTGPAGLKILECVCGFFLLFLCAKLAERVTGDRVCAVLTALMTASIFAGTTSFVEFRGMFDGVSVFLLIWAMTRRNSAACAALIFLSAWTDERGLAASAFVLLFRAFDGPDKGRASALIKAAVCGLLSWGAYFAARIWLQKSCGLKADFGGVGLGMALGQMNNLPLGLWSAFEGGWIIIVLGAAAMALNRKYALFALFCAGVALFALASMSVADITRSIAYMLPAFFIAARELAVSDSAGNLRKYFYTAFLLSLLWPSCYAGGKECVWWHSPPLPVQILRMASSAGKLN
jgi:hypothetical protein